MLALWELWELWELSLPLSLVPPPSPHPTAKIPSAILKARFFDKFTSFAERLTSESGERRPSQRILILKLYSGLSVSCFRIWAPHVVPSAPGGGAVEMTREWRCMAGHLCGCRRRPPPSASSRTPPGLAPPPAGSYRWGDARRPAEGKASGNVRICTGRLSPEMLIFCEVLQKGVVRCDDHHRYWNRSFYNTSLMFWDILNHVLNKRQNSITISHVEIVNN